MDNFLSYGSVYLMIPVLNASCVSTILSTLIVFVPHFLAQSYFISLFF